MPPLGDLMIASAQQAAKLHKAIFASWFSASVWIW